jgi:hypothetical protein
MPTAAAIASLTAREGPGEDAGPVGMEGDAAVARVAIGIDEIATSGEGSEAITCTERPRPASEARRPPRPATAPLL